MPKVLGQLFSIIMIPLVNADFNKFNLHKNLTKSCLIGLSTIILFISMSNGIIFRMLIKISFHNSFELIAICNLKIIIGQIIRHLTSDTSGQRVDMLASPDLGQVTPRCPINYSLLIWTRMMLILWAWEQNYILVKSCKIYIKIFQIFFVISYCVGQ